MKDYISEQVRPYIKDNFLFSADLARTIPIVLYSYQPIPSEVFINITSNSILGVTFPTHNWAIIWPFKKIFIQLPFLLLSILEVSILKNKNEAWFSLILFFYFFPIAKYFGFYNPTAYDTRYFLPAIVFLSLGLPAFIDFLRTRQAVIKWLGLLIVVFFSTFSIWNGLLAIAFSYEPHLSGEQRFELISLLALSSENLKLILKHAFPNIYNLLLLIMVLLNSYLIIIFLCEIKDFFTTIVKKGLIHQNNNRRFLGSKR